MILNHAGLQVCAEKAAEFADVVDEEARFPREAIDELRERSFLYPTGLGRGGYALPPVSELTRIVRRISAGCSNTGMVVAMHYCQLSALVRYAGNDGYLAELLRSLIRSQGLIASSTTERATGGDTGRSSCAVEYPSADTVELKKEASVISYAQDAAAILVTARRSSASEPNDQVLVVCDAQHLHLTPTSQWDALGMRGTGSSGYLLEAEVPAAAVLNTPYSRILESEMLPVTHMLWASVWLGMSDALFAKTRKRVQANPNGSEHHNILFYEMLAKRQTAESHVGAVLAEFDTAKNGMPSFGAQLRANMLKTIASENLVQIAVDALHILGMPGYVNRSPQSITRVLRDSLSAPLMVGNDRIRNNSSSLAILASR